MIAAIASRAHGLVTRSQLLRAGVTVAQIEQRLRTGALIPEHRGVYVRAAELQVFVTGG